MREMGSEGFLEGVRVLELADELGEYCGKLLAGLGADVIKIEPPDGEITRTYGPFYEDKIDRERSLYFWNYNFGKRGITLDLDTEGGREALRALALSADVLLDTRPRGYLEERGLGHEALRNLNPRLSVVRITPFGEVGPWSHYKGSDLVHLALGGVMMNCGYDPDPSGFYETPPIAPQMWQSYHIAGEMAVMALLGALYYRSASGRGQYLSVGVHGAVAQQTESDIPNWVYLRRPHARKTARHSMPTASGPVLAATKDGRWVYPYRSYVLRAGDTTGHKRLTEVLAKYGLEDDLCDPPYENAEFLAKPAIQRHVSDVIFRFANRFMFDREIWREFQAVGLTWAPVRKPEENLFDEHWRTRETFVEVEHPELGETFVEVGAKWMCPQVPWREGPRAPLLDEHRDKIIGGLGSNPDLREPLREPAKPAPTARNAKKPSALAGVRYIDLGWMLASAGAGRFLAAQGAEVIKVEHKSRPDGMRVSSSPAPDGLRDARDRATAPMFGSTGLNRSGAFMEINAGKRAISLNLKHPRGKAILTQLLEGADAVGEGYSPGTMDRMGFGYDRLVEINPSIIYVQQSGMGQAGVYGNFRSYGPTAQAFSGMTEMAGLPEPFPPSGIGYSFLDWFGAYNMAVAVLAALNRRQRTGKGCWIDSSQVEAGTYLTGSAILDFQANRRSWSRYGNRSPYKVAAPNGAFRTAGDDHWIAISCFTDEEWKATAGVLGRPEWTEDSRFRTLSDRVAHETELEVLVNAATISWERYALMDTLQQAGVAAGVCQTAEDRIDIDPQLKALGWLVELPQSEIGTWPAKEFPVSLSETPAHLGGIIERHGPNYGEDNEYVYGELLGFSSREIRELEEDDVI
jgi:crotonobetainyl-CoA:carnitine CoA-transferase CaiB-like acyl-CoA transferase